MVFKKIYVRKNFFSHVFMRYVIIIKSLPYLKHSTYRFETNREEGRKNDGDGHIEDLRAAFDSVDRELLIKTMKTRGEKGK